MSAFRISAEEVRHIARLARLSLEDGEIERLTADLASILDHVDRLSDIELPPAPQAAPRDPAPLRPDEPSAGINQESALEAAPASRRGHFVVPRVVG